MRKAYFGEKYGRLDTPILEIDELVSLILPLAYTYTNEFVTPLGARGLKKIVAGFCQERRCKWIGCCRVGQNILKNKLRRKNDTQLYATW